MKRVKLALLFNFNPKWTGGIIYLVNISRILKFLEPADRPELLVFYPKHLKKYVDEIDYEHVQKIEWDFPSIYTGFVKSLLRRENVFISELSRKYNPDVIFPMHNYPVKSKTYPAELCWYADLQHKYYPEFFTKVKRMERDLRIRYILKNAKHIVVSSHDVKNDFYKFYHVPDTLKFHVYHFVSIIEGLPDVPIGELLEKYKLPANYFMVSNQFHKHKNHKVVFEALAKLKSKGVNVCVAITGRFPSEPNSPYLKELHDLINNHNLHENIALLGLIPRGEQLLLMKYAQAIIQPSLFEGWSTVIEDARSLQVPVIAADLKVNIEQLEERGFYFNPKDADALASLMERMPARDYELEIYEPYMTRMRKAAYELLDIFKNSMN
jgi:glycosyltransferase involved in cell wall biosynthesis